MQGCKSPQRTLCYTQRTVQGRHPVLATATLPWGSTVVSPPPTISRTPKLGYLQRVSHQPTVSCPPWLSVHVHEKLHLQEPSLLSQTASHSAAGVKEKSNSPLRTQTLAQRCSLLTLTSPKTFSFQNKNTHFTSAFFYRAALSPWVRMGDFSVSQLRCIFYFCIF